MDGGLTRSLFVAQHGFYAKSRLSSLESLSFGKRHSRRSRSLCCKPANAYDLWQRAFCWYNVWRATFSASIRTGVVKTFRCPHEINQNDTRYRVDSPWFRPRTDVQRIFVRFDWVDGFRHWNCLLYTSPSPRDGLLSRMPSSA